MLYFAIGAVFGAVIMTFTLGIFNLSHDDRLIQETVQACNSKHQTQQANEKHSEYCAKM